MAESGKVTLTAQIGEVKRELALRRGVYPGFVAARKMRQAEADLHLEYMGAVLDTLEWLRLHEPAIREALAAKAVSG